MEFQDPPRRRPPENMLPMINVVFLLLIFFLMSAQLVPPEPFPVEPPEASGGTDAEGPLALYLGPEGEIGYRDQTGEEAALAALLAEREALCGMQDCNSNPIGLQIRADAATPGRALAALLPTLGSKGFTQVELITVEP